MIRYKGYEHTHTNPEKTETTAHRQPKTQIKPEFLQKKNLNQILSYSI